ncbi:hypothetical protein N7539_004093 [Penicillium diatomitis]|uniref:Uncharacterized protein n=1 Tax=Penicillium diatomitis TaxID=2819901 RepID=A0A9W9XE51_9EURO|nr:uncharacterized protein N7539_004093 [Penicillium diatomitis]KAJ5489203.1 hypothetical protein N7539_004093 [Penicillium diatomitis]
MHATYLTLAAFAVAVAAVPDVPVPSGNPFEGGSYPFLSAGSSAVEDGGDDFMPAYEAAMQAMEIVQSASYSKSVSASVAASRQATSSTKAAPTQAFDKVEKPTGASQAWSTSQGSAVAAATPSAGSSKKNAVVYEYASTMSVSASYPGHSNMAPMVVNEVTATSDYFSKDLMAPTTITPVFAQKATSVSGSQLPSGFVTVASMTTPTPVKPSNNLHQGHLASASAAQSSARKADSSSSASLSPSAVASDATSMLGKIPVLGSLFGNLGI